MSIAGLPSRANPHLSRNEVYNDLLLAADKGGVSALCLLDMTAALDTVNHDLLISRLERQFGLCGVVLQWFISYLSDRSIQVVFKGSTSCVVIIFCSVPQGSVLSPDCLFFRWRTCWMWLQYMMLTYTRMLMTLSCICSVAGRTG